MSDNPAILEIRIRRRDRDGEPNRVDVEGTNDSQADGLFSSPFSDAQVRDAIAALDLGRLATPAAREFWGRFAQAVRIAVISDSCHSGSVSRDIFFEPEPIGRWKMLPREAEKATYEKQKALYDGIQDANPQGDQVGVGASVLLLSGCLDNQRSADGDTNGAYTAALLRTWADGSFSGGYRTFQEAIGQQMPPDQTPAFFVVGLTAPLFESQTPFTI